MLSVRSFASAVVGVLAGGLLMPVAAHAEYGDTTVLSTVINDGRPIVMGAGAEDVVTVPVQVEVREDSGDLTTIEAQLEGSGGGYLQVALDDADNAGNDMTCAPTAPPPDGADSLTCTGVAVVHQYDVYSSMIGQPVSLRIRGYAADSGQYDLRSDPATAVTVLNGSVLSAADATPEPVRRGGTLTVTGQLTQPDRSLLKPEGYALAGYGQQEVQLEFAEAGATDYRTVIAVTSAADGELRTEVPASASGAWRWSYGGSSTTAASVSAEDSVTLLRVAKLTTDATPEPVRRGGRLTVTGRLVRATTDAATSFTGYGDQPVELQFRASGSSTFSTVKTVRTDARGRLATTTTARRKGYWRWNYGGSATVASVPAAGDKVSLR